MPKLSEAEVGDQVVLRGTVIKKQNEGYLYINFPGGPFALDIDRECEEIIPKPHEWKIGDKFTLKSISQGKVYTIQGLFNNKVFLSWDADNSDGAQSDTFLFNPENYVLYEKENDLAKAL